MAGISHPGAYIYVCTRLQIRKGRLIPEDQYQRMLQMSSSQIIRMIGEGDYRAQVLHFTGGALNANQIEQALTDNLALSFQRVLDLAPGMLGLLTSRYLARWDIINVMLILHGKEHRISRSADSDRVDPCRGIGSVIPGIPDRSGVNRSDRADA